MKIKKLLMFSRFVSRSFKQSIPLIQRRTITPFFQKFSTLQSKHDNFLKEPKVEVVDNVDDGSLAATINQDTGLTNFVKRVYLTAGATITSSLTFGGLIGLGMPEFVSMAAIPMLGGGFFLAIGGCIGMDKTDYTINNEKTLMTNSFERQLSFGAVVCGMTLVLAPVVPIIHGIDPTIWPTATLLSIGTMGLATAWAHRQPAGALLSWQKPMMFGLGGLVCTGLTAVVGNYFFPGNMFFETLHNIDIYGGIILFTGMTAYETHVAVKMYQNGKPDHLICALNVYLDFINLLIRIAEALAKAKKD